ncbi:MAG: hypothetical protein IKE65_01080 [Clostridia bacterium]|nr:hypothetical protein [Clostridia bacterium]
MKQKRLFIAQIGCFGASALALAFAGLTNDITRGGRAGSIIIGIIFWLGLIAGIILCVLLSKQRKAAGFDEGKIGLIGFFSNKAAIVFDCLMIVSCIASIVFIVLKSQLFIGFISIALFFFSLEMHCVLNGKNYKYITSNVEE